MGVGWLTKCNAWRCTSIRHAICISYIVKDEWISEFFRNSLHFKRLNVLQMFFFNLVEGKVRLFTNKLVLLALLHLRSFRQFQILSEETWSRVAENFIELCFLAFLGNKSKKCFILV